MFIYIWMSSGIGKCDFEGIEARRETIQLKDRTWGERLSSPIAGQESVAAESKEGQKGNLENALMTTKSLVRW